MLRWLFPVFLVLPLFSSSQHIDTLSSRRKVQFADYLYSSGKYKDALYVLSMIPITEQSDSSFFLTGMSWFRLQECDSAQAYLKKVNMKSFHERINVKALFTYNHCSVLLNRLLIVPDSMNRQRDKEILRLQQLASFQKRNMHERFDSLFQKTKCKETDLAAVEFNLYLLRHEQSMVKTKKPYVAAMMSAVIPGSGKVYAGKPYEALNIFIPVVFNYAQAAEGLIIKGFESPRFYIFGSIGTVFYLSNIYGSAKAVSRANSEKLENIEMKTSDQINTLFTFY